MEKRWLFAQSALFALALMVAPGRAEDQTGYLYIETDPPGGRILIDGNRQDPLPAPVLCTLTVGVHNLSLYSEHYQPNELEVVITPDRVLRRRIRFVTANEIELLPESGQGGVNPPGALTLVTDVFGAAVHLDSIPIAIPTPLTLPEVPAGEHHLRLEHSGLGFDTVVTVQPYRTTVVELYRQQLWEVALLERVPEDVTVAVMIELPGCTYQRDRPVADGTPFDSAGVEDGALGKTERYSMSRRYEVPLWEDTAVGMRGVDPTIRIITPDTIVVVTHRPKVDRSFARLPQSHDLKVAIPAMTERRNLTCAIGELVAVEVELYVNQASKFVTFDQLEVVGDQFRVRTDLNRGEPVNVRIIVDADGAIHFRYW